MTTSTDRQKQLGAYYTPRDLASKLIDWAIRSPTDRVIDPSFGGFVFLELARDRLLELGSGADQLGGLVYGIDVDEEALLVARGEKHLDDVNLRHADFFSVEPDELPTFTANARFGFLCSGSGTITVTCDDDTYDAVLTVNTGAGGSGDHSLDAAVMVWMGDPLGTPSVHTDNRSLDTTLQSSPHFSTFSWEIADTSGSQTLRVYTVALAWEWPDETAQLPA